MKKFYTEKLEELKRKIELITIGLEQKKQEILGELISCKGIMEAKELIDDITLYIKVAAEEKSGIEGDIKYYSEQLKGIGEGDEAP